MPTETFKNLPQEKKDKIIEAAKIEFARVPFSETSIKNIVDEAKIARGSFYQYFESKEDLLTYILQTHAKFINNNMKTIIEKSNGDIFKVYINLYENIIKGCGEKDSMNFYKRLFENVKASDDGLFTSKMKTLRPKEISEYYQSIDTSKLKAKDKKELKIISDMLFTITRKAIVSTFKSENKQIAKEEFLKQLEYIKYGIVK